MLARSLLLTLLIAACGVGSAAEPPDEQPDKEPPIDVEEEGQHFCCETLAGDASEKGGGNGCVTIDKSHLAACDKILYCGGSYEKDGGKVTCKD